MVPSIAFAGFFFVNNDGQGASATMMRTSSDHLFKGNRDF